MLSSTSSANKSTTTTGSLAAAFSAVAGAQAESNLIGGVTWNGDVNYSSLGNDFQSALLALDQKMVLPEASRKARQLDPTTKSTLDWLFDAFTATVTSMSDVERAKAYGLMFRYLFYLRSVRVAGKKSRLLFYYLFKRLYAVFPKTCVALVELVPDFGYFGDLDALVQEMSAYPDVVAAAEGVYIKHLNADCLLIFDKPLSEVTKDEAQELNTRLKSMKTDEVRAFVDGRHLSLAPKWFKREGKRNSGHREEVLVQVYFPNGGIRDLQSSPDVTARNLAKKRLNWCQMVFRNVISALSQCLLVGETMMCEEDDEHRTWADIDIEAAPATFMTKYRKALANELLKTPVPEHESSTGNRFPYNADRVECRENLQAALLKGKLNGAAQDIDRLSKVVYGHLTHCDYMYQGTGTRYRLASTLSSTERAVIAAQWTDLVTKLKTEIIALIEKEQAEATAAGTQFIDPRNVIPVVDTSGSMEAENVQDKAVGLGILGSHLSTMPGCLISFSDKPQVFNLDMSGKADVFDHFLTIMNGPSGLNTNIDATYDVMLGLMKSAGVAKTDFAMLFLTDGQFDAQVTYSDAGTSSFYDGALVKFGKTALGRLEAKFAAEGYPMPRIIFWNFCANSPGFPASGVTRGVQLVSSYSQSLMLQVFTGDYKEEVQADGTLKVSVDPWTSFYKAITNEGYDPVMQLVAKTGESCLVHLRATV